jgi:hypothetical protein
MIVLGAPYGVENADWLECMTGINAPIGHQWRSLCTRTVPAGICSIHVLLSPIALNEGCWII